MLAVEAHCKPRQIAFVQARIEIDPAQTLAHPIHPLPFYFDAEEPPEVWPDLANVRRAGRMKHHRQRLVGDTRSSGLFPVSAVQQQAKIGELVRMRGKFPRT